MPSHAPQSQLAYTSASEVGFVYATAWDGRHTALHGHDGRRWHFNVPHCRVDASATMKNEPSEVAFGRDGSFSSIAPPRAVSAWPLHATSPPLIQYLRR